MHEQQIQLFERVRHLREKTICFPALELTIDPAQIDAYKRALKEEIASSIRSEADVLALYAVSVKGHPEQIRLLEIYSGDAAYQAHLQSAHFRKYKEARRDMVKSLKLRDTDPVLLGSKLE